MQGFIIFDDYGQRYDEFYEQMISWLAEGRIKYREDVIDGLENAVKAFVGLLDGKNFGKLIIRIAQD
jgi:NADPH-dependent curcumin reductase CurA